MTADAGRRDHAALMDGVYGFQRHFYDATRKFYLLGRDHMIEGLDVPPGGTVLELGCGTGRNLARAATLHPGARLAGLDISAAMLETAASSLARQGLHARVRLARGDATAFDPRDLFGVVRFDRVFISYALSMIPDWQGAVRAGMDALAPAGALHVVDFGDQSGLPGWFRTGLRAWLARFHVTPRDGLRAALESESERTGASLSVEKPFRGYAVHAILRLPA
jgi:S-adenosylmethionine-diacylgycerolhomoserine-N-methlytransferase